jgi:GxxExxY protein
MLSNPFDLNPLTSAIIDAAIAVHRETGPGLLEALYTECLTYELQERKLYVETNYRVPLVYRGHRLSNFYFIDLRVEGKVIVEVKSVAALAPIHTSQLLTYLKLTGCSVGLLINFNVPVLKEGLKRVIRRSQESSRAPVPPSADRALRSGVWISPFLRPSVPRLEEKKREKKGTRERKKDRPKPSAFSKVRYQSRWHASSEPVGADLLLFSPKRGNGVREETGLTSPNSLLSRA